MAKYVEWLIIVAIVILPLRPCNEQRKQDSGGGALPMDLYNLTPDIFGLAWDEIVGRCWVPISIRVIDNHRGMKRVFTR